MTEELFRDDATLLHCNATVAAVGEAAIELDRSVFYPQGGGQAGDTGRLRRADGAELQIVDTRKGALPGQILHAVAPGTDLSGWALARRSGPRSTPSGARPIAASTPPLTCCVPWCPTRWTVARSPQAMPGWTST